MGTIPVLMYHHVNTNKGDMITVTPEVFEAQMRHIRDAGYRTLSLDELSSFLEGRLALNDKSVVVTFDDGYLDNYLYAFPVLKSYGIRAAIFLVSSWVDSSSASGVDKKAIIEGFRSNPPTHRMAKALIGEGRHEKAVIDWAMAREMMEAGVEFHSHTMTHRKCASLGREELTLELKGSKEALEKRLGSRCSYLCWPKGSFTDGGVGVAGEAGYRGVFTTNYGVAREGDDPYRIRRIAVKDGVRWFKTRLSIYTNPRLAALYTRIRRRG